MKNARRCQPNEGDANRALFITQLTGCQTLSRGLPPKKEEFRRPGSAQMGDEKRLGAGAPVWLTGFTAFFIALLGGHVVSRTA
jgi:hypothetical protein